MTLASRLKDAVEASGHTQREIAKTVGITEVSLSRYVTGERTPSAATLGKIAEALNVSTDYLIRGKRNKEMSTPTTDPIRRNDAYMLATKAPYLRQYPTIAMLFMEWFCELLSVEDICRPVYCKDCRKQTDNAHVTPKADVPDTDVGDLIDRQLAIDAVQGIDRLTTLPDNDAVIRMSEAECVLYNLPPAQPELIEKVAYIRGFEQGRTQGMIDSHGVRSEVST